MKRGVAAPGVVLALEDEHARAFADHEAVPILVERTAGSLRVIVTCGEGSGVSEAGERHRRDGRFAASREDRRRRRPHRIRRSASPIACAPEAHAETVQKFGPLQSELDRDLPGRHVGDHHRDEERTDPARAPLLSSECWASKVSMPPMPDPRMTPDAVAVDDARDRARSSGWPRGWPPPANWTKRSIRFASLRSMTPSVDEVLHLARETRVVGRSVESRDRACARTRRRSGRFQNVLGVVAERRDHAGPGDEHRFARFPAWMLPLK